MRARDKSQIFRALLFFPSLRDEAERRREKCVRYVRTSSAFSPPTSAYSLSTSLKIEGRARSCVIRLLREKWDGNELQVSRKVQRQGERGCEYTRCAELKGNQQDCIHFRARLCLHPAGVKRAFIAHILPRLCRIPGVFALGVSLSGASSGAWNEAIRTLMQKSFQI